MTTPWTGDCNDVYDRNAFRAAARQLTNLMTIVALRSITKREKGVAPVRAFTGPAPQRKAPKSPTKTEFGLDAGFEIAPELRIYGGAKGIRTPDLLDANEWTWAFVAVDRIGCRKN